MVATRSFSASQVVDLAGGMVLVRPVARQYRVLQRIGEIDGRRITPAGKVGAGWRDMALQRLFYAAAHGDAQSRAILKQLGTTLASNSSTSVARPGTSSHGDSTRIDVLVNGLDVTAADAAWMERNGWDHEFGMRDPNHFHWTGSMSGAVSESKKNRIVAHWANEQRKGRSTSTDRDGDWPASSNFSWLLQTLGHEAGLYPTPKFKIDGERGPRTVWVRDVFFERLVA